MGMYDSFSAEVTCKNCEHTFYDDGGIQSKDFACSMDNLAQGERTDKLEQRYMWADGSLMRGEGRWETFKKRRDNKEFPKSLESAMGRQTEEDFRVLTRDEILEKYNDKTKIEVVFSNRNSEKFHWDAYHIEGKTKTVFDGIHGMDFNCYTRCQKCNASLGLTGHIVDDVFTHVTCDSAEPRED